MEMDIALITGVTTLAGQASSRTFRTDASIVIIAISTDTAGTIINKMVSDIAHADICLIFYVMLLDAAGCACQGVVA